MDCPKCNGKLQSVKVDVRSENKFKPLQGAEIEYELDIDQCFVCGGVWFDKGELDEYLSDALTLVDSKSLGTDIDEKLNSKKGKCPVCQIEMLQKPYALDRKITIDSCPQCDGVWLDTTEIDRVEALGVPGHAGFAIFHRIVNAIKSRGK